MRMAYRQLFHAELDPDVVLAIREATNGNIALGNNRFQVEVETVLGRRAGRGKPGRPPAPASEPKQSLPS